MADRIVLHIGAMKTGTSFVQSLLLGDVIAHADAGYLYLGKGYRVQVAAVNQVLKAPNTPERQPLWWEMADRARKFEGELAVVSMEFMSFAREHQVRAFLEPLKDFDVQVVLMVRDQFTAIPAQWSSYTRRFGTDSWSDYLRRIDPARREEGDEDSRAARTYTQAQSLDMMVKRWGTNDVVNQLDIITLPPSSEPRDALWKRFTDVIGMPADIATNTSYWKVNASQGHASSEVLRRLNTHLTGLSTRDYHQLVRPLFRETLVPLRDRDSKPQVDRAGGEFARAANQRLRDAILAGGHTVHGSLDALPIDERPDLPVRASKPDRKLVREAALALRERCASDAQVAVGRAPLRLDAVIAEVAQLALQSHQRREAADAETVSDDQES